MRALLPVALVAAAVFSCSYDFDQFSTRPESTPIADGGQASAASSDAGQPAELGGGAGGALAGSAGAGVDEGAAAGAAGAPLVCHAPTVACGDECANTSDDLEHCGSCGNSCVAQSATFTCTDGVCGCSAPEDCGDTSQNVTCAEARCVCNGTTCTPGEVCVKRGQSLACRCNGGATCSTGQTCCESPAGCFDLESDPANCGVCGHACPEGETCQNGACAK